jgi:hypothetical protein
MDSGKSKSSKTAADGQNLSLEEQALVRQWIEYKKVVLDRITPQAVTHAILMVNKNKLALLVNLFNILELFFFDQELNTELSDRSYLTGNLYTDADRHIFDGLFPYYVSIIFNDFLSTVSYRSNVIYFYRQTKVFR